MGNVKKLNGKSEFMLLNLETLHVVSKLKNCVWTNKHWLEECAIIKFKIYSCSHFSILLKKFRSTYFQCIHLSNQIVSSIFDGYTEPTNWKISSEIQQKFLNLGFEKTVWHFYSSMKKLLEGINFNAFCIDCHCYYFFSLITKDLFPTSTNWLWDFLCYNLPRTHS